MKRATQAGFTLVEIMIVVVIIGLLASIAIPAFKRVADEARITRFVNDLRVFRSAMDTYILEEGEYPVDFGTGTVQEPFASYIDVDTYTSETPIGGNWDVENNDTGGVQSAIGVHRFEVEDELLIQIDEKIDDGLLDQGKLRKFGSDRLYWIVEE